MYDHDFEEPIKLSSRLSFKKYYLIVIERDSLEMKRHNGPGGEWVGVFKIQLGAATCQESLTTAHRQPWKHVTCLNDFCAWSRGSHLPLASSQDQPMRLGQFAKDPEISDWSLSSLFFRMWHVAWHRMCIRIQQESSLRI
jgi:hypothetical protein